MRAVGFEPTPLARLAPEASSLDHSAKLPFSIFVGNRLQLYFFLHFQ